jgi:protein-L-isoaspartate O-methyltransferase
VPDHLLEQLKVGGKMVVAVGSRMVQDLTVVTKTPDGPEKRKISPVVMTPMIEPQDD